jgi:hypothetical protein
MNEEKKWIAPTDDMPRKVAYHVLINNERYAIYDIPDAYHSLGSGNGSEYEDHYFIYYGNEWCPFFSKAVHRICWEIKYKQTNSAKHKWNDWQFSKRGNCEMWANGKLIYSFPSYDMNYALAKAQYMEVALLEFPGYNFLNPEKEKGRKVWWYGLPATIQPSSSYPWEISIHPDYSEITKEEWWKLYREKIKKVNDKDKEDVEEEKDDLEEAMAMDYINWGDAFHADGRIDWFRK